MVVSNDCFDCCSAQFTQLRAGFSIIGWNPALKEKQQTIDGLYRIEPRLRADIANDKLAQYKELYARQGAGRTNLAYGYARRAC